MIIFSIVSRVEREQGLKWYSLLPTHRQFAAKVYWVLCDNACDICISSLDQSSASCPLSDWIRFVTLPPPFSVRIGQ